MISSQLREFCVDRIHFCFGGTGVEASLFFLILQILVPLRQREQHGLNLLSRQLVVRPAEREFQSIVIEHQILVSHILGELIRITGESVRMTIFPQDGLGPDSNVFTGRKEQ